MILHSPAEPRAMVSALTRAATSAGVDVMSALRTERMGVDFAWRTAGRWFGIQRKELQDFLASLDDGRLAKEIAQMRAHITMPYLVLEGKVQTANGHVITSGYGRPVTLSGLHKRLVTIQSRDIAVMQVSGVAQTAEFVVDLFTWSQAEGHNTAATRPKPAGDWGTPTNRDYQIHLLSGLPGVGQKTAEAILDTLGRCPLTLDITPQELVAVPGVGKVMARRIFAAIEGERGGNRTADKP